MGTVKKAKAKLLVLLIVFMLVFSNCGFTLSAIASSEEFQVITNGFFKKDEISFNAYFEDENGNEVTKITGNVNQTMRLILDISPQVDGYLRMANLKAVSEDGSDVNFKITGISYYEEDTSLDGNQSVNLDISNEEETTTTEEIVNEVIAEDDEAVANDVSSVVEDVDSNNEETTSEEMVANETVAEETVNELENVTEENTVENVTEENLDELSGGASVSTSTVSGTSNTTNENVVSEVSNSVTSEEVVTSGEVIDSSETTIENEIIEEVNSEDILIDEEKVIEEKTEEAVLEEDNLEFGIKILSDNEVELQNIIKNTKIVLELQFEMGESLNVSDLMKTIQLQLSGTYINSDLEEVAVAKDAYVTLEWTYTKDVELTSEFTKFSPFEVGDIKGTIVENKITVAREITDEKYLPIKTTKLEVDVPVVNGKSPTEINVICEKLLATRGEDTGYTTFDKSNWAYDAGTGKIQISVENTNLVYTSGMDEYVIIYRYEDIVDAETSDLNKIVKLTVEEYSGNENNIITKEINEIQNIKVDVGELVTYSISTTEDKINKAKIYANYNNETPIYETEYTSQVNVNILTSDILEELKINCNQEVYKDINGFEFTAEGIEYKSVNFSYSEISALLVNGGEIVITSVAGEVLYTLNKDIISSEEDCKVNLNGQTGIIIYARNIQKNGSLNFEVVKAIKNCNYEKSAFKNFTSIESRITAEVKYQEIEETLALPTIGVAKEFEEASTVATLSINKETLSTTKTNANVEIKIELNNDKENSDLYINPAFEIVFPKYVNGVTIQNANVLYENGLKIGTIDTYTENDIVKIKVELEGTQKTFSESTLTNGTNIIITADIEVDEYTPKKEDQIKLYYCNEGVSTYQSQTVWSISKQIPNDILKTTNGFDVAIVKYQAPSGLIAINGIVNYDGYLSEVKSVKQGEVKEEIETNSTSKIMTMELLVLNNTDNKCTDVVLLGRIPFEGVKDVVTNEDLGTTVNTVMKDLIKEDISNTNTVDIYYSSNPDATKDLDNIGNGWTKEVSNLSQVKSFLISVKGAMTAGQVLRYTYDFEIPANLPYETNIEGSFGAFYNNHTDVAVVYESSVADTVGLTTEVGPKVEATLSVDIGDGAEIGESRFLKYTLNVSNFGSVDAQNVNITIPRPNNATIYEYNGNNGYGNNNYIASSKKAVTWTIDTLKSGESKEFSFIAKTGSLPTIPAYYSVEYKTEIKEDENGYYYDEKYNSETQTVEQVEKTYITSLPDIYVESTAEIQVENLAITVNSNTVKNLLVDSLFDIEVNTEWQPTLSLGSTFLYMSTVKNISGKDQTDVDVEITLPDTVKYIEPVVYKTVNDSEEYDLSNVYYDETTRKVTFHFDEIFEEEALNAYVRAEVVKGSNDTISNYYEVVTSDGARERSSIIERLYAGPGLELNQSTNIETDSIKEGEHLEFVVTIENTGNYSMKNVKIKDTLPENLLNITATLSGSLERRFELASQDFEYTIDEILVGGKVLLTFSGTVAELEDNLGDVITNKATVEAEYIDAKDTEAISIKIIDNPELVDNNEDENYNDIDGETTVNSGETSNKNSSQTSSKSNSSSTSSTSSNTSSNSDNTEDSVVYSITGYVWEDTNSNSRKDSEEKGIAASIVQLYKNETLLMATTTDSNGKYTFNKVASGNYKVMFKYDSDKYIISTYNAKDIEEELNSDAIEISDGTATTNTLVVSNQDYTNINLGLQIRDTFDFAISKYISSATITLANSKDKEKYEFDNLDLAKLEIASKNLEGADVELVYTIIIENLGDVEGITSSIVDYIPEEMTFDESKNFGWYLGTDGNAYNNSLKEDVIAAGETRTLTIVLSKEMNSENTGVVSNRIELLETTNNSNLQDNKDNNVSTQETLILIKTGNTFFYISTIIILFIIIAISYISINNKDNLKKIFKMKKIYR